MKEKLRTDEDKLLFILVYKKTYPLQTMHGLQFGLSQPQTNEWIHRLLPVLCSSLAKILAFKDITGRCLCSSAKKKPKGKDLSAADQWMNGIISGGRVVVKNTISGVKRCRIVKDVFRNTKDGFSDLAMKVACALHNLRIDCRHPVDSIAPVLQLFT